MFFSLRIIKSIFKLAFICREMEKGEQITQEQFLDIVSGEEVSWQSLIYELINTEQLDPWDIDLAVLTNQYLQKIREIEEANFFVSSKVLYAASLLLRLKAEVLLHTYIKNLDEVLFGKKEEPVRSVERLEIPEDALPGLYPRTPLPRYKRVTLEELMSALNKAMSTETRRIRREIRDKQAEKLAEIVLPRSTINLSDKIRDIFARIKNSFLSKGKMSYTELAGNTKEERIASFLPILHLDSRKKVWLEQEKHFDEIWIWMYEHYRKQFPLKLEGFEKEIEEEAKSLEISKETGFGNPLGEFFGEMGNDANN